MEKVDNGRNLHSNWTQAGPILTTHYARSIPVLRNSDRDLKWFYTFFERNEVCCELGRTSVYIISNRFRSESNGMEDVWSDGPKLRIRQKSNDRIRCQFPKALISFETPPYLGQYRPSQTYSESPWIKSEATYILFAIPALRRFSHIDTFRHWGA